MFTYCLNNPIQFKDFCGFEPTEAVDTDGDGQVDYYRYDYTYTHILWVDNQFVEYTVSGSVYYYSDIGKPETLNNMTIPEDFDPCYDLMVGYYLDKTDGKDNPTMYAPRAHLTTTGAMIPILKTIQQCDRDFDTPWKRDSLYYLYVEWDAHKAMAISPRAQNVDFDNLEDGKGYLYFYGKAFIAVCETLFD